jgi:hypothetical protein
LKAAGFPPRIFNMNLYTVAACVTVIFRFAHAWILRSLLHFETFFTGWRWVAGAGSRKNILAAGRIFSRRQQEEYSQSDGDDRSIVICNRSIELKKIMRTSFRIYQQAGRQGEVSEVR